MLERIREGSQGIIAKIIIGLIILTFALAGVGSYLSSGGQNAAATVNGVEISVNTVERAYQNQRARMESQYGEAFGQLLSDSQYLKSFRSNILEQLIGDEVASQYATKLGIRVSDEQIKQAILEMQEFQLDGKFNNDRYIALLSQAGYSPSSFSDYLRRDMSRQQLVSAVAGSEFALENEAQQTLSLQQQTRDVRYLTVNANEFADAVDVTEELKLDYYNRNIDRYDTEEAVKLAYVELKLTDLLDKQVVTETQAREYYTENLASYQTEPEVRASHILVEFGDDAAAAELKVQQLLSQLEQGADFATLAAAESTDTFSAENGGDLDWFGKGVMEPAFEDAAFGLTAIGDVSEIIETSFGFHIIKLTDLKAVETKSFSSVADEVYNILKTEAATTEFYELQSAMAALAFELPDELEELATTLDKTVASSTLFTRSGAPAELADTQILNAAFSLELIEDRVNSELIELSDEHVIVVRVEEHQPVRTRTFDEVSADVTVALTQELSLEQAEAWMMDIQARLQAGESVDSLLTEQAITWVEENGVERFSTVLANDLKAQLFKATVDSYELVTAGDSISLLQLLNINDVETTDPEAVDSMRQRIVMSASQRSLQSFIELLKTDAVIQRFER